MTEKDETTATDENNSTAKPNEEPGASGVDLTEEAGNAGAAERTQQSTEQARSLEDLQLDEAKQAEITAYVSKAVNDAIAKRDAKHQKQISEEGYMNKAQIENLLAEKDAEYSRRESAKETFLTTLGKHGITPGSEDYGKVQAFYQEQKDKGNLTPHILLTEGGVNSLVHMSGVGSVAREAAGPRSGLTRSDPNPDGSVSYPGGEVQLNVQNAGGEQSLADKVLRNIEKSVNQ